MNGDSSQPAATAWERPSALRRPSPLVPPALGFIAGILLSEHVAGGSAAVWRVALVVPLVLVPTALALAFRRQGGAAVPRGLLVLAAIAAGYARHQTAVRLPPDHVAHLTIDQPVLTRLAGRIVTPPLRFPAEKRNRFLPFDPPPRTQFVLAARELRTVDPPLPLSGYVRVSVEGEGIEAHMGDLVELTGKLYRPRGPRNWGEPDWSAWNRAQGIHAGMSVEAAVHVRRLAGGGTTLAGLIGRLRAGAQSLLFEPPGRIESDQAQRLLDAMVLGQRSAAGREINQAFLRAGGLHFLAVSGFHVGVVGGAVWLLIRRVLRRGARPAALATVGAILLYALIAEPNAPILRATTMGVLLCAAQLTRRPFSLLNWLACAALCILSYSPLELLRPGFQISFVVTFALVALAPPGQALLARRRWKDEPPADADTWTALAVRRFWHWASGLIVCCICAWVAALPLICYHFGRFAPWGAVQSLIILPLVVVTIVTALATLGASLVLPVLGGLFGVVLRGATAALLRMVELLSQLPGSLLEVSRPPAAAVLLAYACPLALGLGWPAVRRHLARRSAGAPARVDVSSRLRRSWQAARAGLVGATVVLTAAGVACLSRQTRGDAPAVHVLALGNGSATLLTTPKQAALFDAGTSHNFDAGQTAVRAARRLGVRRLDVLAVSHANFDHYSGVPAVLTELPVGRLVLSPWFRLDAVGQPALARLRELLPPALPPIERWQAGDRFRLGAATLSVLWPPAELDASWSPNDRSLVIRVEAYGRRVLLTGDIESAAMRELLVRHASGSIDLRADVVLAPHHGAVVPGVTARFYQAVAPAVVVVSTSRERPKLAALLHELFGEATRLVSTDVVGAVRIELRPDARVEVQTPFAPQRQRNGPAPR